MTIASYSELVSEAGDYLNRTDLGAKIPTFVRLFEAQMNRRLRSPDMEQTFTFTTVSGTLSYAINSRVREIRELYLSTDGTGTTPTAYTVVGENIVFADDPAGEFDITYSGYATLLGLSSGNATNWLLDDHPDAYLFGTLAQAHLYLKDVDAAETHQAVVDGVVAQIQREANQKRLPAGPLQMQPAVRE